MSASKQDYTEPQETAGVAVQQKREGKQHRPLNEFEKLPSGIYQVPTGMRNIFKLSLIHPLSSY